MKHSEVKASLHKPVRVAYLRKGNDGQTVSVKGEGLLHFANFQTEMAEVWMRTGEKVIVHFWNLRKHKNNKVELEDKIINKFKKCTTNDVQKAFECLVEAVKIARYYGDARTWMTNNYGNFLGEIREVRGKKAQELLSLIERSFN